MMCRKSIEMATSVGDSFATCEYCSKEYEAIKYGDPMEHLPNGVPEQYHDCNAHPGEYHHQGCDNERCPKCGGQMIGFHGCDVDDDIIF